MEHHDIALADRLAELEAHLCAKIWSPISIVDSMEPVGTTKGLDHKRANQEGSDQCDRDDHDPLKRTL